MKSYFILKISLAGQIFERKLFIYVTRTKMSMKAISICGEPQKRYRKFARGVIYYEYYW